MHRPLLFTLLAGVLLVGCADTPKDVPIEDRGVGIRTQSGQAAAGPAATPTTESSQARDATGTPGVETAPGSAGQTVETYALPPAGEQLQGVTADGSRIGEGGPGGKNPLKDPDSLLSRRIIHFDFDSAAIREEYSGIIEAHATYLKAHQSARVILQGHTDERGSREYNLALGQRRAESVQRGMVLLGVAEAQIEAVSLGEEKPVAEGHNEAAWAQNRRVEIHYHGE